MNRIAKRATVVLLPVLILVAGMIFFLWEYHNNGQDWVMFSGSPHVYKGNKPAQGILTDRDGTPLLDLSSGSYASETQTREVLVHWTGDREGNVLVPFLREYALEMSGYDRVNGVYNYGNAPGVLRLTLDAELQRATMEAMGDYKGTVAVYNYLTGELLCAVTTPNFDPVNLPDIAGDTTGAYTGAYMNRFTQSTYIPGSIFKIVTMGAALESVAGVQEMRFTCEGKYMLGRGDVTCEHAHGRQNLKEIFSNSCNCAFAQLVELVGREKLKRCVEQFGVTDSVSFDGITTVRGNFDISDASAEQVAWSGIGQHKDQINPCAYLTFLGAIARDGMGLSPHVVAEITVGEETTYLAEPAERERIMSSATAQLLQSFMRNNVVEKYGVERFPELTVCAKTGTAQVGGGRKSNAMLAGFVLDENCPLAFIAAIEDGGYGSQVCIPIVSKVLSAYLNLQSQ